VRITTKIAPVNSVTKLAWFHRNREQNLFAKQHRFHSPHPHSQCTRGIPQCYEDRESKKVWKKEHIWQIWAHTFQQHFRLPSAPEGIWKRQERETHLFMNSRCLGGQNPQKHFHQHIIVWWNNWFIKLRDSRLWMLYHRFLWSLSTIKALHRKPWVYNQMIRIFVFFKTSLSFSRSSKDRPSFINVPLSLAMRVGIKSPSKGFLHPH